MSAPKKRYKYIEKLVYFGSERLKVYSIDGQTWSTRKDELAGILERHEAERMNLNFVKGGKPLGGNETEEAKGQPAVAAGKSGEEESSSEDPDDLEADEVETVGDDDQEHEDLSEKHESGSDSRSKTKHKKLRTARSVAKTVAKKSSQHYERSKDETPAKSKGIQSQKSAGSHVVSPKSRATSKGAKPAGKPKRAKRAA